MFPISFLIFIHHGRALILGTISYYLHAQLTHTAVSDKRQHYSSNVYKKLFSDYFDLKHLMRRVRPSLVW